ncbi:LysM peptidoglycan-binding domain-containing protein [Hymenobacter sp. UV11]|uniref:lytic transglycosylase domain-containing protein n=1 Tax=Hymenobacter sp. UV11 TaxID=1849735 RepID=UPI0010605A46|nr:lytic transglycosylase domain-containing protein [Hymenobacter sp. UV11]TDN40514.1 hypothetical protein A8B98_13885 [Hymenobacter sp. UV11]TFZ66471.1 LysM peptidoglycan-binding domain-containing protein [Hymenobacter sp. UV11]
MKKLFPALLLGLAGRSGLTATPPNVPATLEMVGLRLTLDEDARQLVQAKVNSLCRHQASLDARVALAEAAFPLIDQVLAEEGLPGDFRYLALQESALQGNAESAHGAVGYWQLKRETALSLGLTVNGSIDERRHLTASTRAAARYLNRNNATLHNWANALLSYNTGLGGVRPYIQAADADAHDMHFTRRTSQYLLDFVAQKVVFEPACAQRAVAFVPWREVPAAAGQTLAQQAAALAADPAAVAQLNPWLLARTVPEDGHSYTLLVPLAGAAPVAATYTPTLPATALPTPTYLRINGIKALLAQPGETPAGLARRGGASLGFFQKVNELATNEVLQPGAPYFFQRKKETCDEDYHVVAPGQTLAAVAQHYGVLRHALRQYNHLADDEAVQPGLVLWLSHVRPRSVAAEYQSVPASRPMAAAPRPAPARPTPPPAAEEDTTAEELARINDLPTEVPGPPVQSLPTPRPVVAAVAYPSRPAAVPPVPMRPAPTPPARVSPDFSHPYLVAPGETLYALARRVGVRPAELAAWNNLPPTAPLRAGQALHLSPPAAEPVLADAPNGSYVVSRGDTFYSIARRYSCTVTALLAHNDRPDMTLHVGETLRVPLQ